MSWYTLDDATTLGPSREAWLERAQAGEVSSYVDGRGRRWVWVDPPRDEASPWRLEGELTPVWEQVAALRREVLSLRAEKAARAGRTQRKPAPTPVAAEPAPLAAPEPQEVDASRPEDVLELYRQRWDGSDRELERQAGLPKAFMAKAKKGLRTGPKSVASWQRLGTFLRKVA